MAAAALLLGSATAASGQDRDAAPGRDTAQPARDAGAGDAADAAAGTTAPDDEELRRKQEEALAEILREGEQRAAQRHANIAKWLPHTYPLLKRRAPVHIVVIGDSVTRNRTNKLNAGNSHTAYHGVFASLLADEFFYTGGVRDISPLRGNPEKPEPLLGPEITLENLGMNGRTSFNALARVTTDAFRNEPDLVIFNFGINDAYADIGVAMFEEVMRRSVQRAKATGADVILLGSSTTIDGPTVADVGLDMPYEGAMQELGSELGVFYYNLGYVTSAAPGTPRGTGAEAAWRAVYDHYLTYFDHGEGIEDTIHPALSTHQLMGRALFRALCDGHEHPYRLSGFFTLGEGGTATLEFKLKNLREVPAHGHLYLLSSAGLAPKVASYPFSLNAGKGQVFRVPYETKGEDKTFRLPSDAPRVLLPVLITDEKETRSEVFAAQILPVTVLWDVGLIEAQSEAFEVKADLVAIGAEGSRGSYQATWDGQLVRGDYEVPPGGRQPLALRFDLPQGGGRRVRDKLVIAIETAQGELKFSRWMDASRNIGLGQPVEMIDFSGAQPSRATFTAEAGPDQLVLHFDVRGVPFEGDTATEALRLLFQIDARGYGERRKFGFVDQMRLRFAADGSLMRVSEFHPAVFGDGYGRELDPERLEVEVRETAPGARRFSVAIPRDYFYLHEFALGNGNSILGVNATLNFANPSQPTDPFPLDRTFALESPVLHVHSAESLTALELSERPTARWSIRVK